MEGKCSFCGVFSATQEIYGKPCCGFCKTQIEMYDQFAKLQFDIYSGFKRLDSGYFETAKQRIEEAIKKEDKND